MNTVLKFLIAFFMLIATISGALAINETGLKNYYKIDALTSTILTDSIVNNNLTADTSAMNTSGKINSGAIFSGSEKFYSSSYTFNPSAYSISLWAFSDGTSGTNTQRMISTQDESLSLAVNGAVLAYKDSTTRFRMLNDNNGWIESDVIDITGTTWHHVVLVYTGSRVIFYVDNSIYGNVSYTQSITDSGKIWIGENSAGTANFDGKMDEISIWERALTPDEVSELYNGGAGKTYPFSPPVVSNFSVTAQSVDFLTINNFTAVVNGTSYSTTTGTVTTNIEENSGSVTVVVQDAINGNGLYFNKTVTGVDTASNYQMTDLYQAEVNIDAYEIITNNSVFSPLYLNSSSLIIGSGDTTDTHELTAELWNVKAYNDSYYNKTISVTFPALFNGTINIADLYTTILNVKAINAFSGATLNNFSGNITSLNNSYSLSFNTTDGNAELYVIPSNFEVYAEADTFAIEDFNFQNVTIIPSDLIKNVTFELYTNNSVQFGIFDASTFQYITELVNISMVASNKTYQYSTSNGTLYVDDIFDGTYTSTFTSPSYDTSQIFITVGNRSYQQQNVYLTTGSETVTFFVQNNLGANIAGASVTFTTEVNGTPVVVAQETTDFAGIFEVELNPTLWYSITITHSDYETWTGDVKPTQSQYYINMENLGSTRFVSVYEDIYYTTSMVHPANSSFAEFYLNIFSNLGSLQYYGLSYNTSLFKNQTASTGGGTEFINLTGVNPLSETVTITYWFKSTNQSVMTSWTSTYIISDVIPTNASFTDGLFTGLTDAEQGVRVILGMGLILALLLAGGLLTSTLSGASVGGMVGLGVSAYAQLFPLPITIVTLIVLALMLLADNLGGGG